ncbi:MAG: hypothetical protein GEV09_06495 [Pseudonocardiaceae bacterium]|nr:hypothetical protein [Pseudonocardiaceae bacterium]
MEDRTPAEDHTPEDDHEPEDDHTSGEPAKILGMTVPQGVVLLVLVVSTLGFLVGMIGTGQDSTTTSVDLVIEPQSASRALEPGATGRFIVLVHNPNDYGVQVVSIGAGASEPTAGGCPAGTVTSEELTGPPGYIGATGVRTYSINATMAADAGEHCVGQSFTLPLTVELVSVG